MAGEGDSPIAAISNAAKGDEFSMYFIMFGIGLFTIMETFGCETNAADVFPIMNEWMGTSMRKYHYTACSESDRHVKIKAKLDLMETMMKEIETREKKRMAILEKKAETAIASTERDAHRDARYIIEK